MQRWSFRLLQICPFWSCGILLSRDCVSCGRCSRVLLHCGEWGEAIQSDVAASVCGFSFLCQSAKNVDADTCNISTRSSCRVVSACDVTSRGTERRSRTVTAGVSREISHTFQSDRACLLRKRSDLKGEGILAQWSCAKRRQLMCYVRLATRHALWSK